MGYGAPGGSRPVRAGGELGGQRRPPVPVAAARAVRTVTGARADCRSAVAGAPAAGYAVFDAPACSSRKKNAKSRMITTAMPAGHSQIEVQSCTTASAGPLA